MAQGQGVARRGGADIWTIRDVGNRILAKFDHSGSTIADGALVDYVDADNDGIAESVTPAVAARRSTADIAGIVAAEQGIDKAAAKRVIEAALKAITEAAKAGDDVSLPGFGKFTVTTRPQREGRNPATGATLTIAAVRKVSFRPANALKMAMMGPHGGGSSDQD